MTAVQRALQMRLQQQRRVNWMTHNLMIYDGAIGMKT